MHSMFRIPDDVSPSLHPLINRFRTDALQIRGVAAETASAELLYICRFFCSVVSSREAIPSISPDQIISFLIAYREQNSSGSLRWMQVSLRSFLRFAYRVSLIDRDLSAIVPVQMIRRLGTVPYGFPDECIDRLRNGIERTTSAGLRDSAIICLLATYGVRGIQIRRLQLGDVDWRGDRIHFPAAKGGRSIEQHLLPEAGNFLSEYIRRARPESKHPEIFLTLREPFCPLPGASYLSGMIRRHIQRLGLVLPSGMPQGTHGFRHAFASRMVGKIPFKELVDQMGHRDPASTLIYSKVDVDGLRLAALPWPGGEQ